VNRRVRCVRSLCTKVKQDDEEASKEYKDTLKYLSLGAFYLLRSIPCRNRAQPHYESKDIQPLVETGDTMKASSEPDATDDQEVPAPLPMSVYGTTMQPVLLSDPLDEGTMTDTFQFCRRQIEFFTADSEDVAARRKKGGIKQEIHVGQVGIRCVHCAHLSKTGTPSGSISYPASISLVYQAVRNWQSKLWRFWIVCLAGLASHAIALIA
jgi:hypothetical protein